MKVVFAHILLFVLVCTIIISCIRPKNRCRPEYDFQVHLDVFPDSDTYQVGDTITISMMTDNTALIDSSGDRVVNYPNFDPRLNFFLPIFEKEETVDGIYTIDYLTDSISEAEIRLIEDFQQGNLKLDRIDTSDLVSQFTLKMIPRIEGTYALYSFSSIISFSWDATFPDRCEYMLRGNELNASIYFNGSKEVNKELLTSNNLELEDVYWGEEVNTRNVSSAFYFKVE